LSVAGNWQSAFEKVRPLAVRSLNKFHKFRNLLLELRRRWLEWRHGLIAHPTTSISLSARFVVGRRGAIVVGEHSLIAFRTLLLAERPDGEVRPIRIGRNCFIGGGSAILPGVTIGDNVIVGAGSIVTEDIPDRCAVGGNPARVLRESIDVGAYGRLSYADVNQAKYYK
jgi:maltose O-acetyltransferase